MPGLSSTRIPGTARTSSFLKSSPKWPHASSSQLEPKAAAVSAAAANSLTRSGRRHNPAPQPGTTEPSGLDQVFCCVGRIEKVLTRVRKSHDGRGDLEHPHGHFQSRT